MALKRIEQIETIGEDREVYTRIEVETSQTKGEYSIKCSKHVMVNDEPLEKSFDNFVLTGIVVDLELPIRTQLYNHIKAVNEDTEYEDIFED